jgi:hypothetical protein
MTDEILRSKTGPLGPDKFENDGGFVEEAELNKRYPKDHADKMKAFAEEVKAHAEKSRKRQATPST